ncbi:MAG: hypothetical protein KAH32_04705 [Chlamydiia bacterium]|nr:hypothetical protein [Chlamydiia bacterium]
MGYYKNNRYVNKFGSVYDNYGTITILDIFTKNYTRGMVTRAEGSDKSKNLKSIYGVRKYLNIAVKIYSDYLEMMADDVIDGNIVRVTSRKFPLMCVGLLSTKESDRLLDNKLVIPTKKINLRDFGYRLPRVTLFFGDKSKYIDRIVHVPKKKFNLFYDNISKGKKYVIFKSIVNEYNN